MRATRSYSSPSAFSSPRVTSATSASSERCACCRRMDTGPEEDENANKAGVESRTPLLRRPPRRGSSPCGLSYRRRGVERRPVPFRPGRFETRAASPGGVAGGACRTCGVRRVLAERERVRVHPAREAKLEEAACQRGEVCDRVETRGAADVDRAGGLPLHEHLHPAAAAEHEVDVLRLEAQAEPRS